MIDPSDPDFSLTPASCARPRFGYALAEPVERPLVSVVTGSSRAGEVFRETIDCLLGQSLQAWEWLVVDDATPDPASRKLLREAAQSDPRIRLLTHEENRGPGAARNTGVAEARADYVYFIDDDDLIEPTTLEKCFFFLETHPGFDMVNGWSVAFGGQEYLWRQGFDRGEAFLEENLATGRCMVRRAAFQAVGGFDESLREGFEDWHLWLHLASNGSWGGTIPEFMDWYRRRDDHNDRWGEWDEGPRKQQFRERLRAAFPELYGGHFPKIEPLVEQPFSAVDAELPAFGRSVKGGRRMLLVLPWLTMGGSDKFNLDVVEGLSARGWEITIATTLEGSSSWESQFARFTPDIFHLPSFLPLAERPRFLRHLIASRRPDVVLVSHSELGYLVAPYLRAHAPEPAYVDYCHIEIEAWKGGGYPRLAVGTQAHFDLNLVSSEHLRGWMHERGADADAIEVLTTNIDPEAWAPDEAARRRLRAEWGVDDSTAVILFSGRVCEQKQPRVLAGALAELARRGLPFKALVAGDGEDLPTLAHAIRRARLDGQVELLGRVSNEEVHDLMAAADVLFLPSEWEGIALVLFEAMAMELAIVGADVGGQRELVTPETGILLARGGEDEEIEGYASALASLVSDPERARALGRSGRQRIERHFQLSQMLERLEALLGRAAERHAGAARVTLPPELAAGWASQAIEYLRASELADRLWAERAGGPAGDPLTGQLRVEAWLDYLHGARSWQLVRRLHESAPGRLAQRIGVAHDLEAIHSHADPEAQLRALETSRSYRLLRALRSTRLHRAWARLRFGAEHRPPLPPRR